MDAVDLKNQADAVTLKNQADAVDLKNQAHAVKLKNHPTWSRYKNISIIPYKKVKDSTALRVYLKDEWATLLKVTEPPYFETKSPKFQKPDFFRKIGSVHFSSIIVPNHCAKFQKHS